MRRGTLRALCVLSLAVIIYGTLGPLGLGRHPWIVPVPRWQWVPPWTPAEPDDLLTNFAVYLPAGIALRLLCRRRGRAGLRDLLLGVGLSAALSYGTELLQQAMPARVMSLTDWVVNTGAAFVGCLMAVPAQQIIRRLHASLFAALRGSLARVRLGRAVRQGIVAVALLLLLAVAARAGLGTWPRNGWRTERATPAVHWTPFQREFFHSFPSVIRGAVRQATVYSLITLLCCFCAGRSGRAVSLLLILGLLGAIELGRAFFDPRGADTTTCLVALVAWAATCRFWAAFAGTRRNECGPHPDLRKTRLPGRVAVTSPSLPLR